MRFTILAAVLIASGFTEAWADDSADIRERAESGDAAAQFELGDHYLIEAGKARSQRRVQRDEKRAFEWYSKSAEQGFAMAQFNLGRMYLLGRGVPQDKSLGVDWQVKAAEQGLAEAQFEIGHRYLYGGILEQDIELALDMFVRAANQRYVKAQKQLGILYFEGDVVAADLVQSHLWFSVAALNDDKAAKGYLPMLESIMDETQIDEARALAAQWQANHMGE